MNRMYQDYWDSLDRETRAELSSEEQRLVARIETERGSAQKTGLRKLAVFSTRYGFMLLF
jgi:hypothetical protein